MCFRRSEFTNLSVWNHHPFRNWVGADHSIYTFATCILLETPKESEIVNGIILKGVDLKYPFSYLPVNTSVNALS